MKPLFKMKNLLQVVLFFWNHNKKICFRYMIVGVLNTLFYVSMCYFFINCIHVSESLAITLAFLFAACFQFLANRNYSFKLKAGPYLTQIIKYCGLLVVTYTTSMIIMSILLRMTSSLIIASFATAIVNVIVGFLLSKSWVFSKKTVNSQIESTS